MTDPPPAFTFDPTLDSDLDLVRLWTGDTNAASYHLADATITALLASESSVGAAVMASFDVILALESNGIAQTTMVESGGVAKIGADVRASFEAARKRAAKRFGIPLIASSSVNVYRADSLQTEEPDYSNGTAST